MFKAWLSWQIDTHFDCCDHPYPVNETTVNLMAAVHGYLI